MENDGKHKALGVPTAGGLNQREEGAAGPRVCTAEGRVDEVTGGQSLARFVSLPWGCLCF